MIVEELPSWVVRMKVGSAQMAEQLPAKVALISGVAGSWVPQGREARAAHPHPRRRGSGAYPEEGSEYVKFEE